MGYDQRETSGSSGVMVAVFVAILLVVVVGGLLLVGIGGAFYVRTARVAQQRAVVAEMEARIQAEQARRLVESRAERGHRLEALSAEAAGKQAETWVPERTILGDGDPPAAEPDVTLEVSREGGLSVEGELLAEEAALRERLASCAHGADQPISIRIRAHPDCRMGDLKPWLAVCQEFGNTIVEVTSPGPAPSPLAPAPATQ